MIKKSKKRIKRSKRSLIFGSAITAFALLVAILGSMLFYTTVHNDMRKTEITSVFDSLHLSDKYQVQSESIFGDKRVYSWDPSRSFSSSRTYVRAANVDTTVAEIKKAVAGTDFTFYQEPSPGAVIWQFIYKSPENVYLRITVESKLRDDAFFNDYQMIGTTSAATNAIDPNAGPSNVTVKVNLDDNNE